MGVDTCAVWTGEELVVLCAVGAEVMQPPAIAVEANTGSMAMAKATVAIFDFIGSPPFGRNARPRVGRQASSGTARPVRAQGTGTHRMWASA
jgi:hypothetical protein